MARTIEEIYNAIVAEKQSFAELDNLMPQYNLTPPAVGNPFADMLNEVASVSKVAIWKLWIYLVAVALYTHETLWDKFREETEEIARQSIAGNLAWYAAQVKLWQFGSPLLWNHTTYRYYYLDAGTPQGIAKRLAKKVSCAEVNNALVNGVLIKVARVSGGILAPLTPPQLSSLTTYVNRIKFAGVQTAVISLPPDRVRLDLKVYYDGTLDLAVFKTELEAGIEAYLRNIEFDGVLYLNELVDAIQALPGTREPWVYVNSCLCAPNGQPTYTTVLERYEPVSGYFELVPIGSNINADTTIDYIPI
jgi:uncharacterized membrane protein